MAAIDPTAPLSAKRPIDGNSTFTGSVLRIIRVPTDNMSDDEDSDDESIDMAELLNGASDSESDSEEGPSDASKSPKAKRMAQLKEAIAQAQEDDDMDVDADLSSKAKGKARAMDDDDEDDLDIDDSDIDGAEEFVLCTLDPTKVCFRMNRLRQNFVSGYCTSRQHFCGFVTTIPRSSRGATRRFTLLVQVMIAKVFCHLGHLGGNLLPSHVKTLSEPCCSRESVTEDLAFIIPTILL